MKSSIISPTLFLLVLGCAALPSGDEEYIDQGFKTVDNEDWAQVRGCTTDDLMDAEKYYHDHKDSALKFLRTTRGYASIETVWDMDTVNWIETKYDKEVSYIQYLFWGDPPGSDGYFLTHGGIYIRFDVCNHTVVKGGEFRMGG